ncbi:MAG TPA: ATP-binding cassette domain-containing protein [Thermoanaerobaculia bacterium]|nr:ATP-binding cassette domain-containing protein [Thermoanaerobaculia bacterium]
MISFYRVTKRYGAERTALDDVSFEVGRGEFVFLSGASGAGKSTLLRLIYREEVPTSGQILVAGRSVATLPSSKIPFLRRSIGIVFQSFRLIARKTVFENVSYLPRILGEPLARQQGLALEALERVGLGHRMGAFPSELSGGEQQRVAVARALVNGPRLLLADEPTGNLDPDLSVDILRMFAQIQTRGTTVFIATHDSSLIERIGGRVLTLQNGRLVGDERIAGRDEVRANPPSRPQVGDLLAPVGTGASGSVDGAEDPQAAHPPAAAPQGARAGEDESARTEEETGP